MARRIRTQKEQDEDFKSFLKVTRLVLEGKAKNGTEMQRGYASNALVQIHLLDLTV